MDKIISLGQVADYDIYNPILVLSEDLDYDNRFCVIHTSAGNIAFSYYDLEIDDKEKKTMEALFYNQILRENLKCILFIIMGNS